MEKTRFAGITRLAPGESIATDNYAFQSVDRDIIDRLLELGAHSHRHDAHEPIANPTAEPILALEDTGGTIRGDTTLYVCYTLVDAFGGESLPSDVAAATTDPQLTAPDATPNADVDTTAGDLLSGTYYYAVSLTDGTGGETPVGPTLEVDIDPGFANAKIVLTGLGDMVTDNPPAAGWRLYKASGTGALTFLAAGGAEQDSVTDDGHLCVDCTEVAPREDLNTTASTNALLVQVPNDAIVAAATAIRIYMSDDGDFTSPSFVEQLPTSAAGTSRRYTRLFLNDGQPPDVATSIAGANKIDPDTELLDWRWKRPVNAEADLPLEDNQVGDIRLVLTPVVGLYVWTTADGWTPLSTQTPGGGGGGGAATWREPVADQATLDALPTAENVVGDVRLVLDTGDLYHWIATFGGAWARFGSYTISSGPDQQTVPERNWFQFQGDVIVSDDPGNGQTVIDVGAGEDFTDHVALEANWSDGTAPFALRRHGGTIKLEGELAAAAPPAAGDLIATVSGPPTLVPTRTYRWPVVASGTGLELGIVTMNAAGELRWEGAPVDVTFVELDGLEWKTA